MGSGTNSGGSSQQPPLPYVAHGTPDPYLTHFDPRSEHQSYKQAQMRLEEIHKEEVTKVKWIYIMQFSNRCRILITSSALLVIVIRSIVMVTPVFLAAENNSPSFVHNIYKKIDRDNFPKKNWFNFFFLRGQHKH